MVTNAVVTRYAVVLDTTDGAPRDPSPLGGKGAALARLVDIRQPVPPTGVATTDAYRSVAAANVAIQNLVRRVDEGVAVSEEDVDQIFRDAVVPDEVARALAAMAVEVGGGGPVAVRSSATVEDLSGSSFAGQYRSLLNVPSGDSTAMMNAFRQVWASLWYPAPSAYRRAFGIETEDVAMAVVVMAMIPATTAGVVFTADPGGTDGARVEAVEGLGESLVSGERTPSAWIVPHAEGEAPIIETLADQTIATDVTHLPGPARTALDLALAIEDSFGVPQDIEWAAHNDDVYIVQARPITVLETDDGFDTEVDDHELTSAGVAELVPGVLSPLLWDLNSFVLEQAFRSVLDSLGVIRGKKAETHRFIRRVRGRVAVDFDQLRDAAGDIPGAVAQLELQYFGDTDEPTSEPAKRIGWRSRLRRDLRTSRTRRWVIDHADVLVAATTELRDRLPDLNSFDDNALLAYHKRLLDLAARGLIGELGVAAAGGASFDQLIVMLDSYLGDGEGALAAQQVTAHSGAAVERSRSASAAVFGGPTWEELGIDHPQIIEDSEAAHERDVEELIARMKGLPGWRRRRILTGQFVDIRVHIVRRTVSEVVDQLRRREASKAAFLELGGEMRRVHFAFGERLAKGGQITDATDIELLSTTELVDALQGRLELGTDALRRRRNWLGRYDVEGQLPLRFRGIPDREPKPLPEGDVLTGWAASPGRRRGPVRVVTSASGTFEAGEVLVAEATDASWSPLFVRAGAIVVERGGPLSHAAILARELGLPAVLNVEGATQVLEGCTVSVDGDQGVVVIENRGPDEEP